MIVAAKRLLHLAELKAKATERHVARSEAALRGANEAVRGAQAKVEARRADAARKAGHLRTAFVASPQVAAAFGELQASMRGFVEEIQAAQDDVTRAETERESCRAAVAKARAAHLLSLRKIEKRRLMLVPLLAEARARDERRDEQEMEDYRRREAGVGGLG